MKLSDFTETSVIMHWQHPKEDGGSDITKYILEIQEGKKDWKQLSQVENYTTKFKATDLKEGTQYKFRVSAVNKIGQSKPMESDSVVLEKPPGRPKFTGVFFIFIRVYLNYFASLMHLLKRNVCIWYQITTIASKLVRLREVEHFSGWL